MSTNDMSHPAENDAPIGYVQEAKWGEWAATCAAPRCGWTFSQGNRTQADAEQHMRNHAAIVHPPRIPVYRVTPPQRSKADEHPLLLRRPRDAVSR